MRHFFVRGVLAFLLALIVLVAFGASPAVSDPAAPRSGNGHHDFAGGGGVVSNVISCGRTHFAFIVHAPSAPSNASTPTSGGIFNLSVPATSTCGGAGKLVSKPDCLMNVGRFGPGTAQLTARVKKVSGSLAAFYSVGQELEADISDSVPDRLGVFRPLGRTRCQQFGFSAYGLVTRGHVTVHHGAVADIDDEVASLER